MAVAVNWEVLFVGVLPFWGLYSRPPDFRKLPFGHCSKYVLGLTS